MVAQSEYAETSHAAEDAAPEPGGQPSEAGVVEEFRNASAALRELYAEAPVDLLPLIKRAVKALMAYTDAEIARPRLATPADPERIRSLWSELTQLARRPEEAAGLTLASSGIGVIPGLVVPDDLAVKGSLRGVFVTGDVGWHGQAPRSARRARERARRNLGAEAGEPQGPQGPQVAVPRIPVVPIPAGTEALTGLEASIAKTDALLAQYLEENHIVGAGRDSRTAAAPAGAKAAGSLRGVLPEDLAEELEERAGADSAEYVAAAVRLQLERDRMQDLLDVLEDEHGPIPEASIAKAEELWPGNAE